MINPFCYLIWIVKTCWKQLWKKRELKERLAMNIYKKTKHVPWILGRVIAASQGVISVSEMTKTHADALTMFKVADGMNYFELRASSNDKTTPLTGTLRIYARRKNDDLCFVGSVALTTGDQVCGHSTSGGSAMYYVDTMVLTDKWITEVYPADENGNNGMSRISFDITGYDEVHCRVEFSGSNKEWRLDYSGF